jgi:hypothetical protein
MALAHSAVEKSMDPKAARAIILFRVSVSKRECSGKSIPKECLVVMR